MIVPISEPWLYFCVAFAIMLLATLLMGAQGQRFYTKDPIRRKFSMLEMEFPGKHDELAETINGIRLLPGDEPARTIKAVKAQLLLDYLLFIPATYGGIFILCMRLAARMHHGLGFYFFMIVAWGQCVSFILDYIENTWFWILLGKDKVQPQTKVSFILMRILECFKWGFSLIGAVSAFSVLAYFWVSGKYAQSLVFFVIIFFIEILAFLLASGAKKKKSKKPAVA